MPISKKYFSLSLFLLFSLLVKCAWAQFDEFGVEIGATNYFGDLNLSSSYKKYQPGAGVFYRRNMNPYFAWRTNINAGQFGFKSTESNNAYVQYQNLNFKNSFAEATSVIEFNFFKFKSTKKKGSRFTPFVYVGIGFCFNYLTANYENKTIYLPSYKTEGEVYNPAIIVVPLGGGIKYNFAKHYTFCVDLMYHHTYTDYLDDVSTKYKAKAVVPKKMTTNIADPSNIANPLSDVKDKQRGNQYSDKFMLALFTISYTFHSNHCPNPDTENIFDRFDKR
jgi:hypothetical protein